MQRHFTRAGEIRQALSARFGSDRIGSQLSYAVSLLADSERDPAAVERFVSAQREADAMRAPKQAGDAWTRGMLPESAA